MRNALANIKQGAGGKILRENGAAGGNELSDTFFTEEGWRSRGIIVFDESMGGGFKIGFDALYIPEGDTKTRAGADEDQAADSVGVLQGENLRNRAAHRSTDDGDLIQLQAIQEL